MQQWAFDIRSRKFFLILVIFIIVTILVYAKITKPMDDAVINYAQSIGGKPTLDLTMMIFTEIGDLRYMIIFSFGLFIKKSTRRLGMILILSILVGTLASVYIKDSVGQERPNLDFGADPFLVHIGKDTFPIHIGKDTFLLVGSETNSFPSGHATRTAAFALVIGFALSRKFPRGCYLLWAYPILVSISRVYVLQHYPMDVIGGIILGILIAGVVSKKLKLHLMFEKSEP
jgi:undecaprenyl-diphosphatase